VLKWRDNRIAGDEEIYRWLEGYKVIRDDKPHYDGFRKQDKHLYDWQEHQRRKSRVKRELQYREFAAMLRRQYATVAIEDINWRDELQTLPPAEKNETNAGARLYMRVAAVGSLIRFLTENMRHTVKVDPEWSTKTCHACGKIDNFDSATELVHTCRHCQTTWDQDANASLNLLKASQHETSAE
jgi:transposase